MTLDGLLQGMVRIEQPDGSVRYMPQDVFDAQEQRKTEAKGILDAHTGLIPQNGTELLEGLVQGKWDLKPEEMRQWMRAVQRNERAKIPPIWNQDIYTDTSFTDDSGRVITRFPVIDQVINIGVLNLKEKFSRSYQDPVTPRMIWKFRDYLLRDDISTAVFEEIADIRKQGYGVQKTSDIRRVLSYLGSILENYPRREIVLDDKVPKDALQAVQRRMWFAHQTPQAVEDTVAQYWNQFLEVAQEAGDLPYKTLAQEHPRTAQAHRIHRQFPDLFPQEDRLTELIGMSHGEQLAYISIRSGEDFSLLTKRTMEELPAPLRNQVLEAMNLRGETADVPLEHYFTDRSRFLASIGMSPTLKDDLADAIDHWAATRIGQAQFEELVPLTHAYDNFLTVSRQKPRAKDTLFKRLRERAEGANDPRAHLVEQGIRDYVADAATRI